MQSRFLKDKDVGFVGYARLGSETNDTWGLHLFRLNNIVFMGRLRDMQNR